MELDLASMTKEIEAAIEANPECGGNILLRNRVFYRKKYGKQEMLVSLNNKTNEPHYWGHIFWHNKRYASYIIDTGFPLPPDSRQELFKEFWKNLTGSEDRYFYMSTGDFFEDSETFEKACHNLIDLIKVFSKKGFFGQIIY